MKIPVLPQEICLSKQSRTPAETNTMEEERDGKKREQTIGYE